MNEQEKLRKSLLELRSITGELCAINKIEPPCDLLDLLKELQTIYLQLVFAYTRGYSDPVNSEEYLKTIKDVIYRDDDFYGVVHYELSKTNQNQEELEAFLNIYFNTYESIMNLGT